MTSTTSPGQTAVIDRLLDVGKSSADFLKSVPDGDEFRARTTFSGMNVRYERCRGEQAGEAA